MGNEVSEAVWQSLPVTQQLLLEVLSARHRLGEQLWTFETNARSICKKLEQAGLIWTMHGATEHTIRAGLTDAGVFMMHSPSYRSPAERQRAAASASVQSAGTIYESVVDMLGYDPLARGHVPRQG